MLEFQAFLRKSLIYTRTIYKRLLGKRKMVSSRLYIIPYYNRWFIQIWSTTDILQLYALIILLVSLYIQATRSSFLIAIFLKNRTWKLIFFRYVKEGRILETASFILIFPQLRRGVSLIQNSYLEYISIYQNRQIYFKSAENLIVGGVLRIQRRPR